MAVTSDKYEHPLHIEATAHKLAEKLGLTSGGVYSMEHTKNSGALCGYRIVKVVDE